MNFFCQFTGPVVFPMAPPSSDETSGVVVGASGYGFVPPNSNQGTQHQFQWNSMWHNIFGNTLALQNYTLAFKTQHTNE